MIECSQGNYSEIFSIDNSAKELKNEQDFKQKFVDFDEKQSKVNEKFRNTVLKDYSRRNKHKEQITSEKPAYYDKLEGEYEHYMSDKADRMKSAWQFQKNRIEQKYKEVSGVPHEKTKMGRESFQQFQQYKEEQKRALESNRKRQNQYAELLKSQVNLKNTGKIIPQSDKPNHVYLGKYKLHKNSSLPMIPGIHSDSSLTGVGLLDTYNHKFKGTRVSQGNLEGRNKTRNLLDSFKSGIPNNKHSISGIKQSSKNLKYEI